MVWVSFCGGNHPQKLGTLYAVSAGTPLFLDKDVFLWQGKAVCFSVAANLYKLAVGGIFQLVIGGNTDVSSSNFHT